MTRDVDASRRGGGPDGLGRAGGPRLRVRQPGGLPRLQVRGPGGQRRGEGAVLGAAALPRLRRPHDRIRLAARRPLPRLVDERRDPIRSTEAACRYLKNLHSLFGDWNLAIASYNCGPGNVNKAIRRAGGKRDFWSIYPYLPRETRAYLPIFIAASYAMNYADQHGICPEPALRPIVTDTLYTDQRNWEVTFSGKEAVRMHESDYTVMYDGKKYVLDMHIKYGNRAANLIRIYFSRDTDTGKIIVGSMPEHLATASQST